jgi:integrase
MATVTPKSRSARGNGTIFKRGSDGLYIGAINLGFDANGKRQRRTVSARTSEECSARLNDLRVQISREGGTEAVKRQAPKAMTVETYLEQWLNSRSVTSRLKPKTQTGYRSIVKASIVPHLGDIPLRQLTPQHVERMLDELEHQKKAPDTIRIARAVLRKALNEALKNDLVHRNVAALAFGVKVTTSPKYLDDDEADRLTASAVGHQLEPFVELGLRYGLRPGEALALRWVDVDRDRMTISVTGTLQRITGKGLVRQPSPKTTASNRRIPIDVGFLALLDRQTKSSPYVVAGDNGGPLDPTVMRKRFIALCETAAVECTPHGLRHTAARDMFRSGMSLRAIADTLGHASINVTSTVYIDLVAADHADALAARNVALDARRNKSD